MRATRSSRTSACAPVRIAVARPPFSSCVERRPATRPYSVRLLARHHVLHKSGDDREDRAASAAADDLTDDGSDIEADAGRACDRWHRGLQKLTATDAAEGARDRVAQTAEIVVLQGRADGVPANDSRDELNGQIDEHFHDNLLSLADRCRCRRVLVSPAAFGCAHLGPTVAIQKRTEL